MRVNLPPILNPSAPPKNVKYTQHTRIYHNGEYLILGVGVEWVRGWGVLGSGWGGGGGGGGGCVGGGGRINLFGKTALHPQDPSIARLGSGV